MIPGSATHSALRAPSSLLDRTRLRVRLPDGILQQYKLWAGEMPILSAHRSVRRQVLIELALLEGVHRLAGGEGVLPNRYVMRSYSLLLNSQVLRQVHLAAATHGFKCGALISAVLASYLERNAPGYHAALKREPNLRLVRGARFGA